MNANSIPNYNDNSTRVCAALNAFTHLFAIFYNCSVWIIFAMSGLRENRVIPFRVILLYICDLQSSAYLCKTVDQQ